VTESRQALRHRWREALDEWRIPPAILAAADESPWTLPTDLFASRTRQQLAAPSGASMDVAARALPVNRRGVVLDVGAGAGAASLALRGRIGHIVAVDEDAGMLRTFGELAAEAGVPASTVHGRWPDVARSTRPADVVVCHHVLYNVPDLEPFVTELTAHSRGWVVVEITARHPMTLLNPLWKSLHGVDRPERPTAGDALALIASLGLDPKWHAWQRPITQDGASWDELVTSTARRLCLPPDRVPDVDKALRDMGVQPEMPYIGGGLRDLVTIWWPGFAH
jgi:SAM-dependent methyltransferase